MIIQPIAPEPCLPPEGAVVVIALDVDGVLNSNEFLATAAPVDATGPDAINGELVRRLNRLVRPGVAWLLSSSWRYVVTVETMNQMLRGHGFIGHIFGATPMWTSGTRGGDIVSWRRSVGYEGRIIAIDDDRDTAPIETVWTDPHRGITEADVERAILMLGKVTP